MWMDKLRNRNNRLSWQLSRDYHSIDTLEQNYICRWRKMVLAIRLRMQLDYCFPIMSSDGLMYYLTFKWSLRPSTFFYRTNNTHVTTSVSGKLNILCMKLKLLYSNAAHQNICEVGIVRTYGKHLHVRIISLQMRGVSPFN